MRTMEEIIIGRGEIEKIYRSKIELTLWRALASDGTCCLKPPSFKAAFKVSKNRSIRPFCQGLPG